MSDFSDSSYYVYDSEDERIREHNAQLVANKEAQVQANRERKFANYYLKNRHQPGSIFNLPGVYFSAFDSKRIRFRFRAEEIAEHVPQHTHFFVKIDYCKETILADTDDSDEDSNENVYITNHCWRLRRSHLPLITRNRIARLFYREHFYRYTDKNVECAIIDVVKVLVKWTQKYSDFCIERFQRYKRGEDIILSEEEQKLFLTRSKIKKLNQARRKILKRMIS